MSITSSPLKRLSLLAAFVPVALLAGCANMVGTAPTGSNPFSNGAAISGNLHGGNVPIGGATVKLYAAGNTGYGSPSTLYATTTSAADSSFGFTQTAKGGGGSTGISNPAQNSFACPGSGDREMYLVASGGMTQGPQNGTNSDAVLIAPLGKCSEIASNTFVEINEVTTVATMAALQQFFNPNTESFGYADAGATTQTQSAIGFDNGVATVNTLADLSTGTANTTFAPTSPLPGSAVTATPEAAKVNTMANILAACVNSTSADLSNCGTLFANAVPPASAAVTSQPGLTFSNATDTLQAAYFMLVNPTNSQDPTGKGLALYNLSTGVGAPFQTALTVQPTDWTIGVTYGSNAKPTGADYLLTDPEHVAIDNMGNVWIANYGGSNGLGNSITELSPTGGAMAQVLTTIYQTTHNLAIDPMGNVWIPISYGLVGSTITSNKGTTVYEYTIGGVTKTFTTGNDPASIAFDNAGNAFVLEPSFANTTTASGAASAGTLEEIPANSADGTVATTIATNLDTNFSQLALDGNNTIWITGGGTATPGTPSAGLAGVYEFLKDPTTGYPTTPSATATTALSGLTAPEPMVINGNGDVLFGNYGKGTIGGIAATSTTTLTAAPNTPFTTTGLTSPQFMAVDGANNIWSAQATKTAGNNVYAFSATGTALSPAGGFVHTYNEPYGVAIDPTGNVWVGNELASASSVGAQGYVTEIVGAAVPVITPVSAQLVPTPIP